MNSYTFNQKVAFVVAVFSFLAAGGSAADLTTLFGPVVAHLIQAGCSVLAGIGGLFLAMVTGTSSIVKDVVRLANDPSSPVQGVVTTANAEGKALAASIPGPIVSAGTPAAADIAKP